MGEKDSLNSDAIRDALRAAGVPLADQEAIQGIINRPYSMPDSMARTGAEAIRSFNPNGNDVADGYEIAQGVINGGQTLALMTADNSELPAAKQALGKVGGLTWGGACAVGDLPEKSFEEIFQTPKGEAEAAYREFWVKQRAMQDPVSNFLFNGNEDREQRLPRRVVEAMPPFAIMPDGKDICDALHDKVKELDPQNPVIAAQAQGEEAIKDAMFKELTGKDRQDYREQGAFAPGDTPRVFDIKAQQTR